MELKFGNGSKIQSIDSGTNKRSIRGIEELRQRINEFEDIYDDIYFQVHCLYGAKTELYDRTLTDIRSPFDITEAFIIDEPAKILSNLYSKRLHKRCIEYLQAVTSDPFDIKHWHRYWNCSAQGNIEIFNQLVKDKKISKQMLEFFDEG
mgnify:CR=1 FL=1